MCLWRIASATLHIQLPSQPQGITAPWPVPNYTAWWQEACMWTTAHSCYLKARSQDRSQTRDIQSHKYNTLTTMPPGHDKWCGVRKNDKRRRQTFPGSSLPNAHWWVSVIIRCDVKSMLTSGESYWDTSYLCCLCKSARYGKIGRHPPYWKYITYYNAARHQRWTNWPWP